MSANKQVLALIREMNKYYKKEQGWVYPDDTGKCGLWNMHQEDIQEVMENPEKYFRTYRIIKALSEWYLDYSQYALVHLNDQTLQKTAFAQSAWCGYQAAKVKGEFNRFRNPLPLAVMGKVLLFWSNCILAGWFDEAADIGERCIKPPEAGGGLIEEGWSFDRASWFLLELHSRWQHDASLDRSLFANYPDTDSELFIYSDILKHWNTPDIDRVNDYINRMADYHLTQTHEEKTEDDYYEFNNTYNQLYPYEIMAWLKLREHLGIANPTRFNHALMNQPLAKFIPGTPLEKPQMEQVNALLAIVRDALPEAEV